MKLLQLPLLIPLPLTLLVLLGIAVDLMRLLPSPLSRRRGQRLDCWVAPAWVTV